MSTLSSEDKKKKRALLKRALTLASKMDEFIQLSHELYPQVQTPCVENWKQVMYDWYSSHLK